MAYSITLKCIIKCFAYFGIFDGIYVLVYNNIVAHAICGLNLGYILFYPILLKLYPDQSVLLRYKRRPAFDGSMNL